MAEKVSSVSPSNTRRNLKKRLLYLSYQTDIVLSWLAISLWGTEWAQGYTGQNGIANLAHRLLKNDWSNKRFIITGDNFMLIISIIYWAAFIGVLFFLFLGAWRLYRSIRKQEFVSPEEEAIHNIVSKLSSLDALDDISGKLDNINANIARGRRYYGRPTHRARRKTKR